MRFPFFFTDLSLRRWNQEKSFPRCFSLFPRKKVSVAALQLRKRCAFEKSFFFLFLTGCPGVEERFLFSQAATVGKCQDLRLTMGGDTWDTEKREKKLPHSAPFYTWCVLAASFLRFFIFTAYSPACSLFPLCLRRQFPSPGSAPNTSNGDCLQPSLHASIPIPQTQKAG